LTDSTWQDRILNSHEDCLKYLEKLGDIVNDNIDFTKLDEKGGLAGPRFSDEDAAKEYLKVSIELEKILRPDRRSNGRILTKHQEQKFLQERFGALTDLLEMTVEVLHNDGKISDEAKGKFSEIVEIMGDFEIVRGTDGLNKECLKDMLTILKN
jgi:hypothetical protein